MGLSRTFVMTRHADVLFLESCLPRLRMRYRGFRKVRGQVIKRVRRRMGALGLVDFGQYEDFLEHNPAEWESLDKMCRVTISRFYRDRGVFDYLYAHVVPGLIRGAKREGRDTVRCWSAGCASGEEPYTLSLLWDRFKDGTGGLRLDIVATDADDLLLERARAGRYPAGSLKELPKTARETAFSHRDGEFVLCDALKKNVTFHLQDIRKEVPEGLFDLILCRYLAFTYYDESFQAELADRLSSVLRPRGILVLGKHERLPDTAAGFSPVEAHLRIYSHFSG